MNFYIYHSDNQNNVCKGNWCYPLFYGNWTDIIVKGISNITRVTNSNIINRKGSRNIRWKIIKVIMFFIPLQLFFIFFQLSSEYLLKYLCLVCLISVDNKFLWFLYLLWSSRFFSWSFILMYLVNSLFLMKIDFCKPVVIYV